MFLPIISDIWNITLNKTKDIILKMLVINILAYILSNAIILFTYVMKYVYYICKLCDSPILKV